MFTWKPIYREIAQALMAYRGRQADLLAIVKEMQHADLRVIAMKDRDAVGAEIELAEIDPFTFFTNFNRGTTEDRRRKMVGILKDKFGLTSPIPADFHGIPVANLQKAWFFPYASVRDAGDVPALWDLAQACLTHPPKELDADLFVRCLDVKQVGAPKLTMGLFWLNPDAYLALDAVMADYLEAKGIQIQPHKVESLADYTAIVEQVQQKLGTDYPQISRDAYIYANQVPASADELDAGLMALLQQMAEENKASIQQVVAYLAQREEAEGENEITNRINTMPRLRDALAASPLNLDELRKVSTKLWVLANGQDATRRNAFLNSQDAADVIAALLDDAAGIEEMARIDSFIASAVEAGYTDPKGTDASGAAQFASVLMSAKYSDRYADFRGNRWNRLFALVAGSNKRLCTGGSYAWKIIKAGKFAAALAATPTFKKHFGSEHGPWKVAGLAWAFKDGLFKMEGEVPYVKRYWAGGFLWGGQAGKGESHLDEFVSGNVWKTGYTRDGTDKKHTDHWALFDQIKPGDEFAIKGYGGRNDLNIHYVGEVTGVDGDKGVVSLKRLERKLFHGKAPAAGGGNWFGTLLEITDPDAVQKVFHGAPGETTALEPFPLNLILYGPPGTGKTYQSTHKAVRIIDGERPGLTPEQLQDRFDELIDEGRVSFITFHQSYAYEDFVEGIRPVLNKEKEDGTPKYECRDGLFKRTAIDALFACLARSKATSKESEFDARWATLVDRIERDPEQEYDGLSEKTKYKMTVSARGNITAHNTLNPASGEYVCSRRNMKRVFLAHPDQPAISIREINDTLGVGSHAHLACVVYRELKGAKSQESAPPAEGASYEERKEVVLEYLEQLDGSGYRLKSPDESPRYVLVIDEINRGNISKILGELVTLLEPDKRIGAAHQLRPVLPYSEEMFGVPQNLFILGTMNTADKSIALVDVALRRRFQFEELMPDLSCCELLPAEIRKAIETLNSRIALRKDRDHQIGHSYFMDVTTADQFNERFRSTIIPLLQEYFYNDWDGLRFVFAEEKKDDGRFIRKIGGSDSKWARNKWQWFTDAGDTSFDCLGQLFKNFGIGSETTAQ